MIDLEQAATQSDDSLENPIRKKQEMVTRIRLCGLADDEYRSEMFREVVDAINEVTFTDAAIEVVVSDDSVLIRRDRSSVNG